ncbi:hypothetical protein MRX96_025845 [Rhipicephalus microplus]
MNALQMQMVRKMTEPACPNVYFGGAPHVWLLRALWTYVRVHSNGFPVAACDRLVRINPDAGPLRFPREPVVEGKPEFAPYQDMGKHCSKTVKASMELKILHYINRNATFHFKTSDGMNWNKFEALVDCAKNIVKYNLLYVDCDHCKITKCPTSPSLCPRCFSTVSFEHHCHHHLRLACAHPLPGLSLSIPVQNVGRKG